LPPYYWWRTVFFLIPAISLYTIVLGTLSIASSVFQSSGRFAHWCARTWSRLILVTTGVDVEVSGLERLERDRPYVFVATFPSSSGPCRTRFGSSRKNRWAAFHFWGGICGAPGTCWSIDVGPIAQRFSGARRN
jgi:hypothetical protein